MPTSSILRLQIESALAQRVPSALTLRPKMVRPVVATGIRKLDDLLHGGLTIGAITEIAGAECSGRTAVALSFLAQITSMEKICVPPPFARIRSVFASSKSYTRAEQPSSCCVAWLRSNKQLLATIPSKLALRCW